MCGWGGGVSQSDSLKTPFQILVWLVPGTALRSFTATCTILASTEWVSRLSPEPADTNYFPPTVITLMFPLAGSQTPCPQQHIPFRYPPPARFLWDICGCFCLLQEALLSPGSPQAAPPFPHFNRWLSTSRHWQHRSSWLRWRQAFPQGTCTTVTQMSFSLSTYSSYYYLFAFSVKKELLGVSLPQLSDEKLLHFFKKSF